MRARRMKVQGVGAVYHCITRIVAGDFLLEGDREKEVLRNQIWKVADFCGVKVLTYCILSNHVHILLRTPEPSSQLRIPNSELLRRAKRIHSPERAGFYEYGLNSPDEETRRLVREQLLSRMGDVSLFMKELKQRFSIWYNKTHRRFGTLWAERFKSVLIEDDPLALSTVAAYIDLNPVRAKLVQDPAAYRFCGYAEAMGGFGPAREGIEALMGAAGHWTDAISRYRVVIYGKGLDFDSTQLRSAVDSERAAEVMRAGGSVPRAEALRCRVRYFTDGAVLGSSEFVQTCIEARRDQFAQRRRTGPQPCQGSDWGGLACSRALRRSIFG